MTLYPCLISDRTRMSTEIFKVFFFSSGLGAADFAVSRGEAVIRALTESWNCCLAESTGRTCANRLSWKTNKAIERVITLAKLNLIVKVFWLWLLYNSYRNYRNWTK